MRISDWSSDVCSSDLDRRGRKGRRQDRTACGFGGGSQGRIKMAPLPLAGGAARLASLLASRSGEGVGLARDRQAPPQTLPSSGGGFQSGLSPSASPPPTATKRDSVVEGKSGDVQL